MRVTTKLFLALSAISVVVVVGLTRQAHAIHANVADVARAPATPFPASDGRAPPSASGDLAAPPGLAKSASGLATTGTVRFPFVTTDGHSWTVLVHRHVGMATGPTTPVMFVFAGLERAASLEEKQSGFDAPADATGAMVVYVNTPGGSWNAGTCCGKDAAADAQDVKGFEELVTALERTYPFDPDREGYAGFSNGAMFALRLACTPGLSPVVVAGASGSLQQSPCAPVGTSLLLTHYERDTTVPVSGGRVPRLQATIASEGATVAPFVESDGCGRPLASTNGLWRTTTYGLCRNGTTVTLYRNYYPDGTAHFWPRSPLPSGKSFAALAVQTLER